MSTCGAITRLTVKKIVLPFLTTSSASGVCLNTEFLARVSTYIESCKTKSNPRALIFFSAAVTSNPKTLGTFSVLPLPVIQPKEKKNNTNKTSTAPIPAKIFTHKGFFNNLSMNSKIADII